MNAVTWIEAHNAAMAAWDPETMSWIEAHNAAMAIWQAGSVAAA